MIRMGNRPICLFLDTRRMQAMIWNKYQKSYQRKKKLMIIAIRFNSYGESSSESTDKSFTRLTLDVFCVLRCEAWCSTWEPLRYLCSRAFKVSRRIFLFFRRVCCQVGILEIVRIKYARTPRRR
ncbi:hypothetical protein ACHQM5_020229 [Ranunculus cassubicifolius]